jgi:hypothetical protein
VRGNDGGFAVVGDNDLVNLEDRGRDHLRRTAAAADRERLGAEQVRQRGLELIRLLQRHGVRPIRLGRKARLGHTQGWVITWDRRWPGQWGLAMTTDGYVYQLYDGDFGQPLIGGAPVSRVEDSVFVSAAAAVIDGSFQQAMAKKAANRRALVIALIVIFFVSLICIGIGRIALAVLR